MRYLVAFLLIFISLSVNAQNRFPSIDSAKNYVLRFVKNSAVETFTNWRAQNVAYGTLELLDSLASEPGIDSIWKINDTLKYSKGGVTYVIGTAGVNLTFSNGLTKTGDNVKLGGNMTDNITTLNFGVSKILLFDSIRQFAVGNGATNNQHLNVGQFTTDIGYGNVVNGSFIELNQDSILLKPFQGKINIDTLATTSDTSTHKPIVYDISTGQMKYKTAWQNTDTATVVKAYVTNAEAVTITKGQVVYIFGAQGDRASVKLAKNTSDTFSSKTLGIVRADIAAGQAGWVTTQGQVSGINLGTYTAGDILWLDSVAGGFTKVKPVSPLHSVFVGVVERANQGNGLIYVKPQNGVELSEVHDVLITSPTNNQVLSYTASTGIWENKSVTTALGYTPLNVTDTAAMLTPYLRSINAGVRWQGVDSSLASNWAVNGFHEVDEAIMRGSAANNPGLFAGSKYRGTGNWAGAAEDDVNYLQGSTVTSATAVASLGYWDGSSVYPLYVPSSNWFIYTTRVRIPTLNDGTQKFYVNMGVLNAVPSATLSEGVGFLYDLDGTTTGSSASANWQTYSINNSTRTFNQNHTGVAVAANTWTKLKIVFNSTAAYYYVNDVLIATHTSNIPAGDAIAPFNAIIKTAGIVARTYQVDFQTIDIKYSTPR